MPLSSAAQAATTQLSGTRLPADNPQAPTNGTPPNAPAEPPRKASLGQVASTLFWAMCMIGKKGTWERDGARVTLGQAVVGGIIAGIIVVTLLVTLVKFAVR